MDEEVFQRMLKRERAARKEAERILEEKALELHRVNEKLQGLADDLEKKVEDRTKKLYQLNIALDKAKEGFAITDDKGNFVYMNRAHAEIYGYDDPSELMGKNWTFLYDKDEANRLMNTLEDEFFAKGFWSGEATAKTKEGKIFPEVLALTLLPSGGILCRCSDDTDRQNFVKALQLQNSLRVALFDNIEVGLFFEHLEGSFHFINKRFYEIFPKGSDGSLKGFSTLELCSYISKHIILSENYIDFAYQLVKSGERKTGVELKLSDGRFINLDFLPIHAGESYIGNLWAFRDVTKQKKYNLSLEKARSKAEEAAKSKSLFLANMSHEIRTPLNGIIGMNRLLMAESLSKNQLDYVATVQSSAESLLRIINDILDFSKIEAKKMEFEIVSSSITETLDAVADHFTLKAYNKKIDFHVIYDPTIPDIVYCDPTRIRQILLNLISNAVKFTAYGYVALRAQLNKISEDRCGIIFSVEDTGIGMTEQEQANLFATFSQANSTIGKEYGGTGLGLAISKNLAAAMGGSLQVSSVKGQGSVFQLELDFQFDQNIEQTDEKLLYHAVVISDRKYDAQSLESMLAAGNFSSVTSMSFNQYENHECKVNHDYPYLFICSVDSLSTEKIKILKQNIERQASDQIQFLLIASSSKMVGDVLSNHVFFFKEPRSRKTLIRKIKQLSGHADHVESEVDADHGFFNRELSREEPIRVLVAEDNSVNQQVLSLSLKKFGLLVDIVGNGIEAIRQLESISYDLIFMDIRMPEMDGIEACQVIRTMGLDIPIIAMTANAMIGDKEIYMSAGMNGYVSKPVMIDALKKEVLKLLKDSESKSISNAQDTEVRNHQNTPVFDYDSFLNLVGGNKEICKSIALDFLKSSMSSMEEADQALAIDNYEKTAAVIHKLSGGAFSVQAMEIAQTSNKLEKELRKEVVSVVVVREEFMHLQAAHQRYLSLLKEWGWYES